MGNVVSIVPSGRGSSATAMSDASEVSDTSKREDAPDINSEAQLDRAKAREEALGAFRKDLDAKREQRREVLSRHRAEKEELEKSLAAEKNSSLKLLDTNKQLRQLLINSGVDIPEDLAEDEDSNITNVIISMKEEVEIVKSSNHKLRKDLAIANSALQNAYSDMADLTSHNTESIKQINALKEVARVSKTMINLREQQLLELKNKLHEIEQSLADREASLLSSNLKQEYEKQLQNIRTLRNLYEERARLAEVTKQGLVRELDEQKALYQVELSKSNDLKIQVETLETEVENLKEIVKSKNDDIFSSHEETRGLKIEMSAVNTLFSQVLLGYKNKQDLDVLVHRLEENRVLLTQMAEKENGSEASTELPKLLLDLVSQVDEKYSQLQSDDCQSDGNNHNESEEAIRAVSVAENSQTNATAEEIVENLPKVWRVLLELLSHQNTAENNSEKVTTCYKSVTTASGPVLVPSVSQTYIRLKDLIMEKLGLVKEVNRMKQLNAHLESSLEEQEKRLSLVTTELRKTWGVVGRLRRHHHQLHTHEKILKYELQQKRKMLNELKEELECCREKWEQAREKNTQSEKDWKKLRAEFTSRKTKPIIASFNNSGESGYSDERQSDSDSSGTNDESEYMNELVRCKKKLKKSFETIHDSSTDINLAEREDPASDLLDVADLPLDSHECDDNHESSTSECCLSDNLLNKNERVCVETEDEAGNELCFDESCSTDVQGKSDASPTSSSTKTKTDASDSPIDPATILENIKKQNEMLVQKDKRLSKLESNCTSLVKKTDSTLKLSNELNNTLDLMLKRPTNITPNDDTTNPRQASNMNENIIDVSLQEPSTSCFDSNEIITETTYSTKLNAKETIDAKSKLEITSDVSPDELDTTLSNSIDVISEVAGDIVIKFVSSSSESLDEHLKTEPSTSIQMEHSVDGSHTINAKAILENIRIQSERLAKKDARLDELEAGCSKVVEQISNNLNSGENLLVKMDEIREKSSKESNYKEETPDPESSSSNDYDHEARFAARDKRLKILEEQTKSLVSKVNNTTTKGVKIHYKLQELHNIYGSESSRAGTPSEGINEESGSDEE